MSWSIGIKTNELVVSKACFEELKVWAEDEGHYIYQNKDGTIQFDCDAMEHMDFVGDESAQEILNRHKVVGDVVFMSAEGDNAGDIWGYRFKGGSCVYLKPEIKMVESGPA